MKRFVVRWGLVIAGIWMLVQVPVQVLADEGDTLGGLKRLPKALLSWSPNNFESDAELAAWTQVAGACPVHLTRTSDTVVARCVLHVSRDPRNLLAVSYSPMVKGYRKIEKAFKDMGSERVNLEKQRFSLELAGAWAVERDDFAARLKFIAALLDVLNVNPDRVVLMLDHEYSVMNDLTRPVITFKMNVLYDLAKARSFQVFHYNHRSMREDRSTVSGWGEWRATPREVKSDFGSMSMYYPMELMYTRESARRTLANQVADVLPFISLGWQWERSYVRGRVGRVGSTDYSVVQSSILGDDLNKIWKASKEFYYDNTRMPMIWMWPGVGHADSFWPHFYAYHRGAVKKSKAPL